MGFRPKNFALEELVPKATLVDLEEAAWDLLDENALKALQAIRELIGPCEVNTWHKGGPFQFRGWRPKDCPVGAPGSMHKLGCAFDISPKKMTAEEARKLILENAGKGDLGFIRRLERKVNWVHFDTKLTEFDP